MTSDATIRAYVAAWCDPGAENRADLLSAAWATDGEYEDPTVRITGRAALAEHIAKVHAKWPDAMIELTSGISEHHNKVFFSWQLRTGDGDVLVSGVDFGVLAADGRLQSITGFFDAGTG